MANPIEEFKGNLARVLQECKRELGGIRANRPSTALIEDIKVHHYGQLTPLKHMGSISIAPPRELSVQFWDATAVAPAAKAIESSSLGLTANIDGNRIRIFLPELSTERRDELVKHVKKITEQFRIQVRHHRDAANKQVEVMLGASEIGEDQKFRMREDIQKQTEAINKEIESNLNAKIAEIEE
jgi:ribosome recycling factor